MSKKDANYHGEPQKPNGTTTGRGGNSQSPVDKQFQQILNTNRTKPEEIKTDSPSPMKNPQQLNLINMSSIEHNTTIENNGDAIANPIQKDDL
jgi:hypothetical protein